MSFDFYTTYSNLSNVELLKIILQKEKYQSAAILAAQTILNERKVTDLEKAEVESSLANASEEKRLKTENRDKRINESLNSVRNIYFGHTKSPVFYIRAFCVVIFLFWLYSIKNIFNSYEDFLSDWDFYKLLIVTLQVYSLLMIVLLFRLKKTGWILLMPYYGVSILFTAAIFIKHLFTPPAYPFSVVSYDLSNLGFMLVDLAILYYFNRHDVREILKVSDKLKSDVYFFSVILFVLLLMGYLYSGAF